MAGEWTTLPLEDCMAAIIDYRGKSPEKTKFGVPLVTAKIVKGGRIEKPEEFIAEADFDDWMRRGMPKPGDIVMTTEAPLGEVAQLDDRKVALAQRVITLRGKPDLLDNTFLKFLLQSNPVQEELRSRGTGTTVVGIRQSELRKVSLTLPPLAEQKAIAGVLGALDDKIELNRRMNGTLEAMARALFQSWFVDFDPVRRNMDRTQRHGDTEGTSRSHDLRASVPPCESFDSLFPDSFQDSELGHIPKGWTVRTIRDCCVQIQNGGTPRRNEPRFWNGGNIPWLASGEVRQSIITATESFITEEGLAESSAKWVPAFSTVVALYGATAGQVSFTSYRLTTNQAVCALIPKEGFAFFNYLAMRGATAEMENKAVGSAQQNISKGIVEETKVVLPPPALVERFSALASHLFERWISNLHQSRTLAALRDTLLPKLLSGELRIPAAEAMVEAPA